MFRVTNNIRKVIALLFLVAVFSTFVFAYLHIKGMAMSEITMPGCPFMDMDSTALCSMSPLEHIEAWQHLLTVTPTTASILLVLLALLIGKKHLYRLRMTAGQSPFILTYYLKRSRDIAVPAIYTNCTYDFHSDLFSQGILHPKLF